MAGFFFFQISAFCFGRDLTLPDIRPARYKGRHSLCSGNVMAARYFEAMQCFNLIAPERLAEALKIADGRVGLRPFQEGCDSGLMEIVFSVPDDQFRWFRLVLRKMAEKYERHKSGAAVLPQLEFAALPDSPK
jgi:hypothetical protein